MEDGTLPPGTCFGTDNSSGRQQTQDESVAAPHRVCSPLLDLTLKENSLVIRKFEEKPTEGAFCSDSCVGLLWSQETMQLSGKNQLWKQAWVQISALLLASCVLDIVGTPWGNCPTHSEAPLEATTVLSRPHNLLLQGAALTRF